ncbi:hypothetical protein F8388_019499 [Cannabis sativa]|uniref:protein-S-isoprenylcysteine alpha-carbonyl methylesterase n=1 Tax=Cannabis sativa TaxID=3483 RepID=A0A7J6EGN6_CANSA|nr:hypothetical protein F8388_019499 [Cannabis sativa]KAF4402677.1 hypothetical protein G4B88_012462 [Cannabis sativa]
MSSQQILPITQHQLSSSYPFSESNPSSISPGCSSSVDTMLLNVEDDPTARLLISSSFESEKASFKPIKPLLPKITTAKTSYQHRRRRTNSEDSMSSLSDVESRRSLGRDVRHAAAETFLLTRLCLKLLRYLGVGYRWMTRFLALGCYALLLIPVGYNYFFSSQIRRSIVYGDKPRNRLDLYLPKNSDGPKPVIAFVTGGAWIIGYKAWGSLLGQQLSERDIIVACIDYRNFPQGTISDMVADASEGISYLCNHIAEYGGDPNRIYLMGQSAGAHIAACTLLEQAIKENGEGESTSWSVSQLKAYFGLSGGYNLFDLIDHFHTRGLYRSIFLSIMEGEQSLRRFSPEVMVQDPNIKNALSLLPPIILFHGTADYSIPSDSRKDSYRFDPMRGGNDQMFEDLLAIIHADDSAAQAKDAAAPLRRRLVPEFMLKLARSKSIYLL